MTELENIARAQMYLEKLANGVNPLTGAEVGENDVVNNVRIARCLFYTSGILRKIMENKGKFKVETPDRKPFSITPEQLDHFEYAEYGISATEVVRRLNALVDTAYIKEIKAKDIIEWLVQEGLLTNLIVNNKTRRRPTLRGEAIGIYTEERISQYGGMYEAVLYNVNAQKFIAENIRAIITFSCRKKEQV